jgi:hypothetical protein
LIVESFRGTDDEVPTVSQCALQVSGDNGFGFLIKVDHDVSQKDTVIAAGRRFGDEIVALIADEFSEWRANLAEVFGGV